MRGQPDYTALRLVTLPCALVVRLAKACSCCERASAALQAAGTAVVVQAALHKPAAGLRPTACQRTTWSAATSCMRSGCRPNSTRRWGRAQRAGQGVSAVWCRAWCRAALGQQWLRVTQRGMATRTSSMPQPCTQPNQNNCCARPPAAPLQVYRRSGVTRPQLAVIPEPVDSQKEFNPARHTPLPLPIGQLVFGREPRRGGDRGGGAAADFVFLSIFKW